MFNLVNANLYKARKMKTLWVLLVISIICAGLLMGITYGIAHDQVDANLSSIGFLFSDMNMLTILGAVLAASFIGGDFETKQVHHPIVSGYSRIQLVLAKAICYWILLFIIMLPYLLMSLVALLSDSSFSMGTATAGFLGIVTTAGDANASKVIVVLLSMAMIYLAQLSVTIFLAFWLKKAVFVISIFYMISALTGQIALYRDVFGIVHDVISLTPFGIDFIALHVGVENGILMQSWLVSIIFMLVIVTISWLNFRQVDIK